ncbi:CBS domain-containing protein [Parasedimentitalea maritima]|uniref:CBS domain-containing protein n=1 Tax=Parasedimentitalea maritima TaxID=2578117 RepID=A0ABY2UWH8_9RHOB|nr:CBS domain-containing protein [Zongyanglinia marina]TLP62803.1 CBS domain-containing protein [Zongyanglinia marina]
MKASTLSDMIAGQQVHSTSPNDTVRTACIIMTSVNVGALPVVDDNGTLVGIFSERDVIQRSVIVYRPSATTLVKQVMTPNPQWLSPDAKPIEAYQIMIKGKFRHLPICDEGQVLGIVSIRDFNPPSNSIFDRLRGNTAKASAPARLF